MRYHVIDWQGNVLAEYEYGHVAESDAYNRSDAQPAQPFSVIDTRDGNIRNYIINGNDMPIPTAWRKA